MATPEGRVEALDRGRAPGAPIEQSLDMPGDWHGLQDAQQSTDGGSRGLLVPHGAGWVESDTLGVAEEVNRRWPNLRIARCEQRCTDCAALGHYPYVLIEGGRDGRSHPVLGFMALDRTVVDTIWSIWAARQGAREGEAQRLADEHNARVRESIRKRREEEQQAALEVIGQALSSSKYGWVGPNGQKISRDMTPEQARRALTQR